MSAYADPVAQAEINDLRAALRLAMSTLTMTVDEDAHLARLAGLPAEYDDDRDVVLETIAGKLAEVDRLRARVAELEAREQRVRQLIVWLDDAERLHPGIDLLASTTAANFRAALDGTQP